MNKYKTVKEVCDLTGLSRKHLYYFHHEKVVQAAAYANYSVDGNDGYKLYDDTAVEKLQQIALYYQLGLKRNEIRDLLRDRNYDSNQTVRELLAREQEKKRHIERNIAALEYLLRTGTKNGVAGVFRSWSLEELGQLMLAIRQTDEPDGVQDPVTEAQLSGLMDELAVLIAELSRVEASALCTEEASALIERIAATVSKHLGPNGYPFALGMFVSILGEGIAAQDMPQRLSPAHARAVVRYLIDRPQIWNQVPCAANAGDTDKNGRNT